MNKKTNKAVLFDLDGTLIDTAPDMIYALKTVLENNHTNTSISDKTLRKYVSDGSIGLINLVFPNENNAEILRLQSQFLDAYEKNLSRESQIFPHLDDLLFFLENNHFMWGIVTNKPTRMTLQLLKCLELYCPFVVCGDTLRDRKPSPKPLIIASKLMNIDPMNIMYVGDAKRDIEAGRLANMKTISAEYGYIKDEDNPISLFKIWFDEAKKSELNDPNALSLATSDNMGVPSVRMVLLKSFDNNGFVFYTNLNSQKGNELRDNPNATMCFHWKSLLRQIRIVGTLKLVADKTADDYYNTRAYESRIGAWASKQSSILKNREELLDSIEIFKKKYKDKNNVPRPDYWSGWNLKPSSIEFWLDGDNRIHERLKYSLDENNNWVKKLLCP